MHLLIRVIWFSTLLLPALARADGELRFAEFDACPLDSGDVIESCRVGFRVFGEAAADGSNVIVAPTWYSGTSRDWNSFIGPGRLLDTATYAVVVIDALGDGISSSPSNHPTRRGVRFPVITIGDMVRAQHAVVSQTLGFLRVRAVVGISMGGMQALQWAVDFPQVVDKVVSLAGTPKPTRADVRPWNLELQVFDRLTGCCGELLFPNWHTVDNMYQMRAMLRHDIGPGETPDVTAGRIAADVLFVVDRNDNLLQPEPSLALADAMGADVLVLKTSCGHFSPIMCERQRTQATMAAFLAR